MTKISLLQMISTDQLEANLQQVEKLIQAAVKAGAKCVVLPENFALFSAAGYRRLAQQEKTHKTIQTFLSTQAQKNDCWMIAGTIPLCETSSGEMIENNRVRAACLVFNNFGEKVARYDKIHLFDVEVEDQQGRYCESATIEPGTEPVVVETPFGKIGLSVCYDLRFPELYRYLVKQGAEIIAVPSAFTQVTGEAHWQVLLRARAIENQCYVLGCNQGGVHSAQRETFGGSCIIDPWGRVLAEKTKGIGCVTAEIDLEKLQEIRRAMPVLAHRRT